MAQQYGYGDLNDYMVHINSPVGTVTGIIQDDSLNIPFGMSVSQSSVATATDWRNHVLTAGKAIAKKIGGELLGNAVDTYKNSVKSVKEFIKTYENSGEMDISFSMIVIPGKFGMSNSVNSIVSTLSKMTMPKVENNGMSSFMVTASQVGALAGSWKALDNKLCFISIGDWFHTSGVFWCTSASTSISTIIDSDGKPSHLNINFVFSPYRPLTPGDISGWVSG